ncbi:unnamed protein product [Euphydryas editha]|uniref:Uncharacterized protein n=1 Tax=Euphydryas editha TaxID=104508 RepID=A0AAU9TS69_EUPED|nr:unnamed protein product [Euphydryas editha]
MQQRTTDNKRVQIERLRGRSTWQVRTCGRAYIARRRPRLSVAAPTCGRAHLSCGVSLSSAVCDLSVPKCVIQNDYLSLWICDRGVERGGRVGGVRRQLLAAPPPAAAALRGAAQP